ncbi:MAG: protein-glutamate O-methyltransferase CheR [Bacteroidales bacterium]|nr:protein-glutamate O-methyltransferase CheR [Bacteroidales bacterium]
MKKLKNILNLMKEQRGFDFSGYRASMLERRVQKRIYSTKCKDFDNYLEYLDRHPGELDNLIDVFTINVSRFFRNSLSFEYITKIIIPEMFLAKTVEHDNSIRIWSAGCSFGEEPYSMAIIIKEFLKKEDTSVKLNIFATDNDKKALLRASKGCYGFESIKKIKYGIFKKYFSKEGNKFKIDQIIKRMVQFSFYDLLDKNHLVPPDSIFGGFDIVLCRNVLIYFDLDYQKIIFNKLYKSLNKNGYLVLGEAEIPVEGFKHKFIRENKYCKIYRKVS